VKKTSYSAAALTVLGTGAALANGITSNAKQFKPLVDVYEILVYKSANGWTTDFTQGIEYNAGDPHPSQPSVSSQTGSPSPGSNHTVGSGGGTVAFYKNILASTTILTNESETGTRLANAVSPQTNPQFVPHSISRGNGKVSKGYSITLKIKHIYPSNP
jgi:hypothetical protein